MAAKINKKILIVEDEESFRWILEQNFIEEGFVVITARDGEEGVKTAVAERPDLILVDILMPKMDGIVMVKKIIEAGISPCIIFLTNYKDSEHMSDAIGIVKESDYLIKSDSGVEQITTRVKQRLGIK